MLEMLVEYVDAAARVVHVWGPLIVFVLMAVESSFFPFPSEVVMIPAGVFVARGQFPGGESVLLGMAIAITCGLIGSLVGAYINYFLSLRLGRPFLHKYGRYFFLKPAALDRAEEIFREYGDVTTFACRLLPAIRQLISIPAGLSRMNLWRFSFFTGLGAGIWVLVLTLIGYSLGKASADMSYRDIIFEGKDMIHHNLHWIVLGAIVLIGGYVWVHKRVMGDGKSAA